MFFLTRITQLKVFFLVLFGLLVGRLFYWQVIKADELLSSSLRQSNLVQKILPKRGQIYSRDNFPIVINKEAYDFYFNKDSDFNPPGLIDWENLAKIITEPEVNSATNSALKKELLAKETARINGILNSNCQYCLIKKTIDQEQKEKIEKTLINNFKFETTQIRHYTEASMAAHLLGFVGKDKQGENTGYFGLEGYYNSELGGMAGFLKREYDAFFIPIFSGNSLTGRKKDGRDLFLNVDRTIQYLVEDELRRALEKYGAVSGTVIVADPNSGAVLAMASLPAYLPDKYWQFNDSIFRNPAIADTYEPGSTFKTITMAIGFDTGAVDEETKCDICHEPYKLDKYYINTWDNKYRPDATMEDVIVHSDNVGMVFVSQKIDSSSFVDYMSKFGFGQPTGIDLQEEVAAPLREKWSYVDRATAAFGQGIAVTPVQMVRAVSAIANGGFLPTLSVANSYREDGKKQTMSGGQSQRVIKKETAQIITKMMVRAMEEGEAKWIKPAGIKVAGKTGTAQIPIAGHYDRDKTIASFVGFAPADNPRYLILTILHEPTSSPWGSETAAPLFFSILKRIFIYAGASPS